MCCPTCKESDIHLDQNFCGTCGEDLRPHHHSCPHCGKAYVGVDNFCGGCGKKIACVNRSGILKDPQAID